MELKKIGILSLGKIAGLFGVIYGLLAGILVSVVYAKLEAFPQMTEQLGLISQLGYSSIIILPILYGIIYFISGIVTAFIYNLLAGWIGGIELELRKQKK